MSASAVTPTPVSTRATVTASAVSTPATVMAPAVCAPATVMATSVMMPMAEARIAKPAHYARAKKGISIGVVASVTEVTPISVFGLFIICRHHYVAARGHALCKADFIRKFGPCGGGDSAGCRAGARARCHPTAARTAV